MASRYANDPAGYPGFQTTLLGSTIYIYDAVFVYADALKRVIGIVKFYINIPHIDD